MITFKHVHVTLGVFSLIDINLEIKKGDYFVLLGPTGSGKTTLAEYAIGIIKATRGELWLDGQRADELKPEERKIGYLPQEYALFSHLSVAENIGYGLWVRRTAKEKLKKQVAEIAALTGITQILPRRPVGLSGGEKQRVALARALAIQPPILILDEPLSAIDDMTREQLQSELKRIHRETGATIIHICHNLEEALILANRIGVLHRGRLIQVGASDDVLRKPVNRWMAEFVRAGNILTGEAYPDTGHSTVLIGDLRMTINGQHRGKISFCLRPEEINILTRPPGPGDWHNIFPGSVADISENKYGFLLSLQARGIFFKALMPFTQFLAMGIKENMAVWLGFNRSSIYILEG